MNIQLSSNEEFFDIQDRLSDDLLSVIEFNFDTLVLTIPDQSEAVVTQAQNDIANNVPAPATDTVALNAVINELKARLDTQESGSIIASAERDGLGEQVDELLNDELILTNTTAFSGGSRVWHEITDLTFTIPAEQAGVFDLSFRGRSTENGRGISTKILIDGNIVAEESVDGSTLVGDTTFAISATSHRLDAGAVVTFELNHNLNAISTRALALTSRLARQSD